MISIFFLCQFLLSILTGANLLQDQSDENDDDDDDPGDDLEERISMVEEVWASNNIPTSFRHFL